MKKLNKLKVVVFKNTWIYKIFTAIFSAKVIVVPRWFFPASCMGPVIVIRERDYNAAVANHEYIHYLQQKEMLFIFAYIMYIVEFICKFFYYFNIRDFRRGLKNAYINVSFEREAHSMQPMIGYCGHRKAYSHFYCVFMKNGLKYRKK